MTDPDPPDWFKGKNPAKWWGDLPPDVRVRAVRLWRKPDAADPGPADVASAATRDTLIRLGVIHLGGKRTSAASKRRTRLVVGTVLGAGALWLGLVVTTSQAPAPPPPAVVQPSAGTGGGGGGDLPNVNVPNNKDGHAVRDTWRWIKRHS